MDDFKWISVYLNDIDGSEENLIVARFKPYDATKAIELLMAISKYNGSARIMIEKY